MKQGLFQIVENRCIADKTFQLVLEGDCPTESSPGQFADIALEGRFLRRPLAITSTEGNRIRLIYKVVGEGTLQLSHMTVGESLDVMTDLGNGFDIESCRKAALIVCGGLGASPVFSLAAELVGRGRKVTVVEGFNKSDEIILADEFKALGAEVHIATMDGSVGTEGFVTDAIKALNPEYDFFYSCGPKPMMKAVCELLEGRGQVSLEERMGCGCGICYGCTCHTKQGPKRICADGPVFDKEDVVW